LEVLVLTLKKSFGKNSPIGPITGPRKGAAAKKLIASPRSEAGNMSAMTPPAFVSGEEPKAPAKNLKISKVSMFLEPAAPALKAVRAMYVPNKRYCRPNSSIVC
jgi:hypothetical protein